MKRYALLLITTMFVLMACEPEEEQLTSSSNARLAFSNDTVVFDTLLSNRTSITKRFRIYNPNEKAVRIDDIHLGKGRYSDYSMIVNGCSGTSIKDQVLFGGDSLLVLVNIDIDPQDKNLPYLVKDSVVVEWGRFRTHVKLVAWGQDATFINGGLICDEVWTAERPYVIYNYAYVDTLCSLTVKPGARIYLDNEASLFVQGSLKINGDSGNHVMVRNTRFDRNYREAPGQWGGIFFLEGSYDHEVSYAEIENGTIGVRVGTPDDNNEPDLIISHTTIRHMAQAGILAFNSDIYAYNTLVYDAGAYLVGNFAGGNYTYEHCTFTNSPSFFINDEPMVQFSDNVVLTEEETLVEDLSVTIRNSIIWGEGDEQLLVSDGGGADVNTVFQSNIIRSATEREDNFTSQERNFPGFADPPSFNFELDSLAFARDKAASSDILTDITGKLRDAQPDIGAFERFDKE